MKKALILLMVAAVFLMRPLLAAQTEEESSGRVGGLSARVFPSVIHVGDEVRLVIQAHFPPGVLIEPISAKTLVAPFEIRSIDKPLVTKKGNGVLQTVTLRLTIFKVGDFKIPSIPLVIWNTGGQRAEANTPEIPVRVISVGKTKDDKADIRPIKGPAGVPLRYLVDWLLGFIALLLTGLLIYLLIQDQKKRKEDMESRLPAGERLLLELRRLQEKEWLSSGRIKEHYSELSTILRRYLERRYGLDVMEHTSVEIKPLLKEIIFDSVALEHANEIFDKTDLVKFARFVPDRLLAQTLKGRLEAFAQLTMPPPQASAKNSKGK